MQRRLLQTIAASPEQLYRRAIDEVPTIAERLKDASRTKKLSATNDWSYVAKQSYGDNWFLVGECLGFADPILAARLTLTHTCAQHCAYTILDLERGQKDRVWLLDQYHQTQLLASSGIQPQDRSSAVSGAFHCLESMVAQGWVLASHTEGRPALAMTTPDEGEIVYTERLGPTTVNPRRDSR